MKLEGPIAVPPFSLAGADGEPLLTTRAMHLEARTVMAITGPSGAGKSLFLKSMFGWAGPGMKPVLRPQDGAYLMIQDPAGGLTPGLDVAGHFREVDGNPGWRDRARALLAELGMDSSDWLARPIHRLSGGERQRLMLALILVQSPSLLVCDEPAASLDPENERRLLDLLLDLQGRRAMTLIFVTHQLDLIEAYAQRVMLIFKGRDVYYGSKDDFFSPHPQPETGVTAVAATHPFHRQLIAAYRARPRLESQPKLAGGSDEPGEAPILELENLGLSLGGRILFSGLNRKFSTGSRWWLQGPSGTGKTSLAKAIAGLLPEYTGHIQLDGARLPASLGVRQPQARAAIQYLFQHSSTSFNPAVAMGRQLRLIFNNNSARLYEWLGALFDEAPDLDRLPQSFSLGELQRFSLIRALACQPRVIIGDELTTPLDWCLKCRMVDFLDGYRRHHDCLILLITHDLRLQIQFPAPTLDLATPTSLNQEWPLAFTQTPSKSAQTQQPGQ